MNTGNLRHMEVSREWLSATRNGVRALNLKHADVRDRRNDVFFDGSYDKFDEGRSPSPRGVPDALVPYPYQLSNFPNLESLFLKGIAKPRIECSIAPSLPNLKALHYTYCSVSQSEWDETGGQPEEYLRAVLRGCVQLRELKSDFAMHRFHPLWEIASLTALTSLSLHSRSGSPIQSSWDELCTTACLSDTISRLVCLQELTLCGPTPTSISPACFSPAIPLHGITLQCENLQRLLDSFTTLHRLESLALDVTGFRCLPDLTPLTSLIRLDIRSSSLSVETAILDWSCLFTDLPWLRVLRVGYIRSLRQLPAEIGCYTSLEVLHLLKLQFSSLPESFGQLGSLTELKLESCTSLTSLPESFSQLQSLQQLVVDDTHLRQVLSEMVELPSCLTSLKICPANLPDCLWSCLSLQRLHVARFQSSSLPEAVGQLTSLTELTITDSDFLQSLPSSLQRLPVLQRVNLRFCCALSHVAPQGLHPQLMNRYSMVHPGAVPPLEFLIHLPSLTTLTLHGCHSLTRLAGLTGASSSRSSSSKSQSSGGGGGSGGCSRLARISISNCGGLSHLPLSLGSLTSLTHLEVVDCHELFALPHSLGNLSSLAELELSRVGLQCLPESFGSLSSLRVLQIVNYCNLRRLPHSFGDLRQLTSLVIEKCSLKLLPGSQGQLVSLQELLIDGEEITLTPQFIPHLPALTALKIVMLKEFPPLNSRQALGVGLFPSLKTLTFKNYREQQQLPKYFWHMSRLTSLTMEDFPKLRSDPDSLLDMPALERLEVAKMRFSAFPPTVSRLSNLTSLVLRDAMPWQGRAALPDWVFRLPALKHLLVDDQYIAALPEELGSLSRLESLRIVAPRLKDLPASLGQLGKLTRLTLESCNKLQRLPGSFTQLVALKQVWLMDCRSLESVPLVNGQLPGGCTVVVRGCPQLELHVNKMHMGGMSEGDQEVGRRVWSINGISESDEEEEVGDGRCGCGCM